MMNARLITIFVTIIMSLSSAIVLSLHCHNAYAQNVIQNVSNTGNSTLPVWWERTNNDKTR